MKDVTLLFATFLATTDYKMYHYVTEYVERFTGIPTLLLNGEDLDDFAAGFIDVGFISASDYVYLSNQLPNPVERIAQPVVQGRALQSESMDHEGERLCCVVRRGSPYYELRDLEQGIFASCLRGHVVGEELPQVQELSLLVGSSSFPLSVKGMVEASSHMQALRLVLNGHVDAAIIEEHVLNLVLRNSVRLVDGVRVLGVECAPKISDVVVAAQMDIQVKQGLREAFRTIHQEAFFARRLQDGMIEQFQVVEQKQPVPVVVDQQDCVEVGVYKEEQEYAFHW